jgi:hypothetical protein
MVKISSGGGLSINGQQVRAKCRNTIYYKERISMRSACMPHVDLQCAEMQRCSS